MLDLRALFSLIESPQFRRTVGAVNVQREGMRDRRNSWGHLARVFADSRADPYCTLARAFADTPPLAEEHEPFAVLHFVRLAALHGRAEDPWSGDVAAFRRDVAGLHPDIDEAGRRGLVQYTDPQRMTDLLPGMQIAAGRYPGKPVRLVELGACAGLLLVPEIYRISYPRATWSPDGHAVELVSELDVPAGLLNEPLDVVDRVGVDLAPVDPETGYDYLRAFTWPGDAEREPRLQAGLTALAAAPPTVVAGDALDLLPDLLTGRVSKDAVTVVVDSAFATYLSGSALLRIGRLLDQMAGRGPLVLLSRTQSPANARGLPFGVTVTDLSSRWRWCYAATDALSERVAWMDRR